MGIGPDLDNKVSLTSCFEDDKESDDGGSESVANFFLTINLEGPDYHENSGPTGGEAVEGMELEFGGSPEV